MLDQLQAIVEDCINEGTTHEHYVRVTKLAKDYTTLITGEGFERLLEPFDRREEKGDFDQRLKITTENTSSIAAPIVAQFSKISRIQNIRKQISYEDASPENNTTQAIKKAINNFYGDGGLESFLELYYDRFSLLDPNAFLVTEFTTENGVNRPYIMLYTSSEVQQFSYNQHGQLGWVLVKVLVKAKSRKGDKMQHVYDYILYGGAESLRYTLIKRNKQDRDIEVDATQVFTAKNKDLYAVEVFSTGFESVQAIRLGYIKDPITNFKTCVSPIQPAVPVFLDCLRTKSNFDITKYFHTFPQKIQQTPACPGEIDRGHSCVKGQCPQTNDVCRKCNGTGRLTITQPTDAIFIATDEFSNETMLQLENLVHYVKNDIETFRALNDNIDQLKNDIYVAVFNSEIVPHRKGTGVDMATATEVSVKREDINNTLLPFAEHKSLVYKHAVRQIAEVVAGVDLDRLNVLYEFPKDLKLSTLSELYDDLKKAADSGAPTFVIEQLINDIANKLYEGDEVALHQFKIKMRHVPFIGLSQPYIQYLDAKGYIRKRDMVLLAYQDSVFADLSRENENFWTLSVTERDALIAGYLNTVMAELPTENNVVQLNLSRRNVESA